MDIAAPLDAYRDVVRLEWIDANDHTTQLLGHDALTRPPQVGRVMGLTARPSTR